MRLYFDVACNSPRNERTKQKKTNDDFLASWKKSGKRIFFSLSENIVCACKLLAVFLCLSMMQNIVSESHSIIIAKRAQGQLSDSNEIISSSLPSPDVKHLIRFFCEYLKIEIHKWKINNMRFKYTRQIRFWSTWRGSHKFVYVLQSKILFLLLHASIFTEIVLDESTAMAKTCEFPWKIHRKI